MDYHHQLIIFITKEAVIFQIYFVFSKLLKVGLNIASKNNSSSHVRVNYKTVVSTQSSFLSQDWTNIWSNYQPIKKETWGAELYVIWYVYVIWAPLKSAYESWMKEWNEVEKQGDWVRVGGTECFRRLEMLFSLAVMRARPCDPNWWTNRLCSLMNAHTGATRPPLVMRKCHWDRLDGNQLAAVA